MRVVHVGRFYFKEDWQSYYEIIDNLKYLIPILEIKQMIGKKVNEKNNIHIWEIFWKKEVFVQTHFEMTAWLIACVVTCNNCPIQAGGITV